MELKEQTYGEIHRKKTKPLSLSLQQTMWGSQAGKE